MTVPVLILALVVAYGLYDWLRDMRRQHNNVIRQADRWVREWELTEREGLAETRRDAGLLPIRKDGGHSRSVSSSFEQAVLAWLDSLPETPEPNR